MAVYLIVSSMSRQSELSPALRFATRAGKMAALYIFASSGTLDVSRRKTVFFFHMINSSLAKLVRSRWLDMVGHHFVSVYKHSEK